MRLENQENVSIIMGVHLLAAVAQVTLAIATSEPCAFDRNHAQIADRSWMDKGRKVRCGMLKIRRNFHETKKKTTFWVVGSIRRRAGWKCIAKKMLEQVR